MTSTLAATSTPQPPSAAAVGFFDSMIDAVEAYPEAYLTIEIVDVGLTDNAVNIGEEVTFYIQISNSGPLHVSKVSFRVTGLHGAVVRDGYAASQLTDEFVTHNSIDVVAAHNGEPGPQRLEGPPLRLLAPSAKQPKHTLVAVALENWDVDLGHPLAGHSDPNPTVKAVFAAEVLDD